MTYFFDRTQLGLTFVLPKLNSGCQHDRLFSVDFLILETFLKQFYEDFWGIRLFVLLLYKSVKVSTKVELDKNSTFLI